MNYFKSKTLLTALTLGAALNVASVLSAGPDYQIDALHYVKLEKRAHATTADPIQTESLFEQTAAAGDVTVTVYPDSIVHDSLTGIGGAFNEQGGEAFMRLPVAKRKELVEALFNPETGAGLTFCRTAIGASDFGLGAYSYSETPEDYTMQHFSVERDTKSVIPFILAAQSENPELKMFASPWSPPGWMKKNGRMDTRDAGPTRSKTRNDKNNVLKADPKIYDAYALYFSKYVQSYAAHGVTIDRILIQNETDMNPIYPGCDMLPDQMSELIYQHVYPQFKKDGLATEIWAGTFRGRDKKGSRNDGAVIMQLDASKVIDGIGLQYASPAIVKALRQNYPEMPLMHTEGKCNNGKNDGGQARARFDEVAQWLYSGVENYCYWNMVLNETSKSAWGWRQNSLVKVDRDTGTITYNPDFAPLALLSRYIRPGDQLLQVNTGEGKTAIAVKNDQRLVVFLQNNDDQPVANTIRIEQQTLPFEVPANSLCAVVFKSEN
jgi:glucosylceramidase